MTDQNEGQIDRINALTATARTSWIALLAFLGYIGVTLLGVEDADFFVASRRTDLPLVHIAIPTFAFFILAPALAAALYVYLQIHLLKLWDALAAAPARVGGEALGDRIHPWLANDLFLTLRGDGSASARPLRRLSNIASRVMVWMLAPFVLAAFWWRSMTAHDEWLTLFLGLCLLVSLHAGLSNWWGAATAARRAHRRPWPDPWSDWWKVPLFWLAAAGVVSVGWLRTEAGFDHHANRAIDLLEATTGRPAYADGTYPNGDAKDPQTVQEEWVAARVWTLETFTRSARTFPFSLWLGASETWNPLAPIDLASADLAPLPEGWRTPETARHGFGQAWCAREGVDMSVCDHPESADRPRPAHVTALRRAWCDRLGTGDGAAPGHADDACDAFFADLDHRFAAAWDAERTAAVANRDRPDLSRRDLRGAAASGASLVGAYLGGARLEGADLAGARLEGANLVEARLEGANLAGTRLEAADLSKARLQGAQLGEARLGGANLFRALLQGADLRGARLEGANLVTARLERADLRGAQLEGANLGGARLEGADLREAWLQGADLRWARLEAANLGAARLEGANLFRAQLEEADLGGARLEGADLGGARLGAANLRYADFRNSNWAGTSNWASPAQFADLRGARGLTQAQLEDLIGNEETLLPDGLSETGAPFHVWSCWDAPPPELDRIVATAAGTLGSDADRADLDAEFLCSPENPRRLTGTPCPVELAREACQAARAPVGRD